MYVFIHVCVCMENKIEFGEFGPTGPIIWPLDYFGQDIKYIEKNKIESLLTE